MSTAQRKVLAMVPRGKPEVAQALRVQLRFSIAAPRASAVFDVFGSDLPDSYFEGIFEHDRGGDPPRDIAL